MLQGKCNRNGDFKTARRTRGGALPTDKTRVRKTKREYELIIRRKKRKNRESSNRE